MILSPIWLILGIFMIIVGLVGFRAELDLKTRGGMIVAVTLLVVGIILVRSALEIR
jgi:uncharacterized membrane protein